MRILSWTRALPMAAFAMGLAAMAPGTVAAGGGGCHDPNTTEATGSRVLLTEATCFSPTILHAEPGAEVEFVSNAETVHNVVSLAWSTFEMSRDGQLAHGETYARTFDEPGYYPYACTLHIGMVGLIIVGNPEVAESAASAPGSVQDDDDSSSVLRWALGGGAAVVALGLVGGGAWLRSRKR
jgi:plastocyanin